MRTRHSVPWYQGGVFYEIFPATFQDSNQDGVGDLRGIANRVNYLRDLGVQAVRLNSIFPARGFPEHYDNVTTFFNIDTHLGTFDDFQDLVAALHGQNISLLLDLPLLPLISKLGSGGGGAVGGVGGAAGSADTESSDNSEVIVEDSLIVKAIKFWTDKFRVDGFYVKGLEHFHNDTFLLSSVRNWKQALGSDRCLLVSRALIDRLHEEVVVTELLRHVDLVDVRLEVERGPQHVAKQIESVIHGPLGVGAAVWPHWSINSVDRNVRLSASHSANSSIALVLLELMLPGTPNLFYGDEISLGSLHDKDEAYKDDRHLHHVPTMRYNNSHFTSIGTVLPWLPTSQIAHFEHASLVREAIALRSESPAIYLKQIVRQDRLLQNTNMRSSQGDLVVVERHYPRRKNYGTFTNFGNTTIKLDLSSIFYSGDIVVGGAFSQNTKIFFSDFQLGSFSTIIVKLDK